MTLRSRPRLVYGQTQSSKKRISLSAWEVGKPDIWFFGDFTHYKGKTYRWQKFASQDGGIIDLDENYKATGNRVVYAYCSVFLDSAIQTNAYINSSNGAELFCNGNKVFSDLQSNDSEKENKIGLSLNKGLNHILIKLPGKEGSAWTYSFRLEENLPLFNHKHKYKLDSKLKKYEAD